MARALALAAALAASLLAVSGAGGASAQTPKRGGTALLNRGGSPPPCLNFLNPRCTASLNLAARFFVGLAMPGAFEFRDDGTQRPRLVSRVEFTRKAPFILTYHIRREARWNDGVPVTAADFVFTYGALRKHFPPSSGGMDMTQVRSVRAMAPKTLRVVLSSRFAAWRSLFDIVLPRHALAGADLTSIWNDAVDDPGTRRPIGSGPFLISRYERDRRDPRIVLTRNPRYWGPHPAYLDRIVFWWSGLGPTDALEALRKGELHETSLPSDLVPAARRTPSVRVQTIPAGGWEHFEFRLGPGGHPALDSKLVRRALAYAIDRETIAREVFAEIAPSTRPSDNAIFFAQSRHYEPNWRIYRHRPDAAARLLTSAGCRPEADGVRVCDQGGRLVLRFVTRAGARSRERTLQLVQEQLRRIGVVVDPVYATQGALFGQILPSGSFDVALFSWGRAPDSLGQLDFYGCGGAQNFTGYCQRLVTRDLDQADRILDAERRGIVLNRVDRQLARDVPVLPLYDPLVAVATRVRGAVLGPYSPPNFEDWWLEQR